MLSKLCDYYSLIPFIALHWWYGKFITSFTGIDFTLAVVGFSILVLGTIFRYDFVLKNDMVQVLLLFLDHLLFF